MRVIVAGSRKVTEYREVKKAIEDSNFTITELVSGAARGVDRLAECWAFENKIPKKQFFPDWDNLGKKAGPVRNAQMADYAEALIAIYIDGDLTPGTANMIENAKVKNLKIYCHLIKII